MARKYLAPRNPAGSPSTLNRGGRDGSKRKRTRLSAEQELFCIKRALEMGVEASAAEVGVSSGSGWGWNRDPLVKARIEELRPLVKEKLLSDEVANYKLNLGNLDLETARVANMQKAHKYRGFSDKTHAIELGYRRLRAILPKSSVSATATAGAIAASGATAKEVYKSRWMTENEERMRLQLEQEKPTPQLSSD